MANNLLYAPYIHFTLKPIHYIIAGLLTVFFLNGNHSLKAQSAFNPLHFSGFYQVDPPSKTEDTSSNGGLPSPNRVALRSAILPGWGQFTNGGYHRWKIPVLYAGFATMGYFIVYNNKEYIDRRDAYRIRVDDDPTTFDKYDKNGPNPKRSYSTNGLLSEREYFRRNRDLLFIITGIVYAANILDAYVFAHLREFDINPDLALAVEPLGFVNIANRNTVCCTLKLKFK